MPSYNTVIADWHINLTKIYLIGKL